MSKYNNSVVYKISSKDQEDNQFYIGSTYDLNLRMTRHKNICINGKSTEPSSKIYKHIRANGGWDNFIMEKIANAPCESRRELDKIEQVYIDKLNSPLNTIRAYQTKDQRNEQFKTNSKKYRAIHKEQISNKQSVKFTCNCGGKHTLGNKSQHRKTIKHQNYINLI
jgi:hypothetical protein